MEYWSKQKCIIIIMQCIKTLEDRFKEIDKFKEIECKEL